jgi:YHS domain-containing protein
MRSTIFIFAGVLMLPFFAMLMGGCRNSAPPSTSQQNSSGASQSSPAVAADDQRTSDPKITAALAELSTEDRVLALKQKICPVSGETLGSMVAPLKVDVKGRAVFICCDGCREQLLAKPDEYLAKINK